MDDFVDIVTGRDQGGAEGQCVVEPVQRTVGHAYDHGMICHAMGLNGLRDRLGNRFLGFPVRNEFSPAKKTFASNIADKSVFPFELVEALHQIGPHLLGIFEQILVFQDTHVFKRCGGPAGAHRRW